MNLKFFVSGLTPLLMHADNVDMRDHVSGWRKDPKNKNISKPGDDRSPPWTWHTYLYHDGQHLAIPTDNLWICLRDAAKSVTLKGQKTFKNSAAAGICFIDEYAPLLVGRDRKVVSVASLDVIRDLPYVEQLVAVRDLGFTLYCKPVKVGKSKHIRVRPKFLPWAIEGELTITADELTMPVMRQIGDIAGRYKGIGDGRPSSPNPYPYGQFSIEFSEV